MLHKASSVFRWRWTLAAFEVSAFSPGGVSELRGLAAAYQTLPKDKATLWDFLPFLFFFMDGKERLLMRLRHLGSDLALGLSSLVSAHVAKRKRETYQTALVSATQVELKGIQTSFLVVYGFSEYI